MKFVADLHIHSHFSRATSKDLNFEYLSKWAQLKGVNVVGTGDIAHPGWLQEMQEKLQPAEDGLFRLKDEYAAAIEREVFKPCRGPVRFMLAGEISNIYKKNDKVRKIHNVVFAPTFEAVAKLQTALEKIGNIRSDGRPILGLDSRDLLEIVLETDPQAYLIPAHIWTPWFALLGSKSGFDSVEECFDDLTPHIFAVETGLSSDPPMNWRLSALDRFTLVSNSDAHSPPKLAREANVFDTELSYPAIFDALKTGDPDGYRGTIEFFPEEGKYHYDGHRKCGIRWNPKTTLENDGLCRECGKPITVGVMHRVEMLADRLEGVKPERVHPYKCLIPLPEILSEVHGVGVASKRVRETYEMLLSRLGPELSVLQDLPLEEIERVGGTLLAEGIRRMRNDNVITLAGYDGEYGVIRLFEENEREIYSTQMGFFSTPEKKNVAAQEDEQSLLISDQNKIQEYGPRKSRKAEDNGETQTKCLDESTHAIRDDSPIWSDLNEDQKKAVLCVNDPLIIIAGPGTGKTRTLTHRMAYLLEVGVAPENLLAITFTNKAAEEMAARLAALVSETMANRITIKTFHAFGAMILRAHGAAMGLDPNFVICTETERKILIRQNADSLSEREAHAYLEAISNAKNRLVFPDSPECFDQRQNDPAFADIYAGYQAALQANHVLDFDDLILQCVHLLQSCPEILKEYQSRFRWISVDEYQDINFGQYRLLQLLTTPETNLCVIGDPDQAIYGFRGADRTYFLRFQKDFPEATAMHLNRNYRSTQLILDASAQVISKSSEALEKALWSKWLSQTPIEIYQAATEKAEAEYVVHEIEKMVGGTSYFSLDSGRVDSEDVAEIRSFSDFGVLYRLGVQSRALIEAFERSGIPFQTVGETPFFEHKEIRQILSWLWSASNPAADFHASQIRRRSEQVASDPRARSAMEELQAMVNQQPVTHLIEFIYESQLLAIAPGSDRIKKLLALAARFEHRLQEFLEAMVLQKETDGYDARADRVTLMTLHASKGLEFPVVFIVGCEENMIPYKRDGQECDPEEERRLFYVGMTRAQEKLILSRAKRRLLFGRSRQNAPSRFLNDIEDALKEFKKRSSGSSAKQKNKDQMSLF